MTKKKPKTNKRGQKYERREEGGRGEQSKSEHIRNLRIN